MRNNSQHWDSNPRTSDQVILYCSRTAIKVLASIHASSVGHLAAAIDYFYVTELELSDLTTRQEHVAFARCDKRDGRGSDQSCL